MPNFMHVYALQQSPAIAMVHLLIIFAGHSINPYEDPSTIEIAAMVTSTVNMIIIDVVNKLLFPYQ
jgi:hypothetical protein